MNDGTTPVVRTLRLHADWPAVEVLYEDQDILALNKPAGLLVAPDRWDKSKPNLMGLLFAGIRAGRPWATEAGITYLANAHRLDQFTSGVLILAKGRVALVNLARQFAHRRPKKVYTALVVGGPSEPETRVDLALSPHPNQPGRMVVAPKRGKAAQTRFTVLERFRRYALVRAEPTTGRMHQIRVHLKALGCPLVADGEYGNGAPLLLSRLKPNYKMKEEGERPLLSRPALHAESIEIIQPSTGRRVTIHAPWPKDLTIAVKYLRKFAAV